MLTALLSVLLCGFVPPQATDGGRAVNAYSDFVARFWGGPASSGRLYRHAVSPISPLDTSPVIDPPVCKGCLWEYVMGEAVLYAAWKAGGPTAADALARLKSEWAFIKATWTLANAGTCGPVAGSAGNAQDDNAWNAVGFGWDYEASGDPTALAYMKAAIDCAVGRWQDSDNGLFYMDPTSGLTGLSLGSAGSGYAPGTGLSLVGGSPTAAATVTVGTVDQNGAILTDTFTAGSYLSASLPTAFTSTAAPAAGSGATFTNLSFAAIPRSKTAYMAPLAWAMLDYSVKAGDPSYQAKAVAIDAFAAANLTQGRPADGLYWVNVNASTYANMSGGGPYLIRKGASVSFLGGNMGFAAVDARLASLTTGATSAAYKARAIATATGIYTYQRVGAVLMDDRDAYTNGWCAALYATWVLPLLPASGTADASTLLATARSVPLNARSGEGTFSGDWDGAPYAWSGSPAFAQNVSANAAIWPVVAPMLAGATP